ncbi:MAG: hypothetical protein ABIV28_08265 [Longimicrobiales bacterium]
MIILDSAPAPSNIGVMEIEDAAYRVTELERAFREYAERVPGLSVEVMGRVAGKEEQVHPVAGFEVQLKRGNGQGVRLYVSGNYGELIRARAGWGGGSVREKFEVRLEEEYGWGDSVFPTPELLVHDLLGYMQFQLDAVAS